MVFTEENPHKSIQPGDVILTYYGVAVIIKILAPFGGYETKNEDKGAKNVKAEISHSFKARLWREPGKSISSSSTAYIQSSCVSFIKSH